MKPPPGVKSNFTHPEIIATTILAVNWIFTPLAALMVCVRVRTLAILKSRHKFGLDDTLIILAMLGSIAYAALVTIALNAGFGRHTWDIPVTTFSKKNIRLFTSFEPTYFVTAFLVKLSILLLYKRFFGVYDTSRRLIYAGIGGITIVTIAALSVAVARAIQCTGIQDSLCHTHVVRKTMLVTNISNAATDLYILIIPINRILRLNVDMKKKLGLLAIFTSGLAACIMSIVRVTIMFIHYSNDDQVWNGAQIAPFS
ncbi:hypothetical protein GQ44DRAFT_777385 [Phaeosphaeriaceae sp. PMI808]|nr:hypothetical protein GQ44DRAFT_777385 [Phaeosphaeriaceae sp. PMI808]